MPLYLYILAGLFNMVPVFCSIRQLKWIEDSDRASLNFPNPVLVQNNSTVGQCLSMCSNHSKCDGVTFLASTMLCRGHALNDVSDVRSGVASPGTRMWTNANCRRTDYIFVEPIKWCFKFVPSILPITRSLAESTCLSENARLVWVDSQAKHDLLVTRLLPILPWFISGKKISGVWKFDDGTPVIQNATFWNPLPSVPLLSNCLCYFTNLLWPCVCLGLNGYICEEV